MYPFWEPVIAPLVRISGARRIVEIGALRGETTAKMLEDLGPDAEIHVIDPLPQFDPTEHEARFPGQYIFHRDLSLNVLPEARAFDLALIDGDHNWYTVYNECSLLREASRREGRHLPLMVLHDVAWPYGRRDLYYDPSNVPEDQQQPWDTRGMAPGRPQLLKRGGMNVNLANAITEGGPRNGVRTGLDDFIAEHDTPIRQVILPIYYGLAIVAEEAYLDEHPQVRETLDRLESITGVQELLELSEAIRLDEVVFSHNIGRMNDSRLERAIDRHLDLLRGTLVDEHYVENEVRIDHLVNVIERADQLDPELLRSPRQHRPPLVREYDRTRTDGDPTGATGAFAYADIGRRQLDAIHAALDIVRSDGVEGDFVDVGCGAGGVGIYFRGYLDAHEDEGRTVWVADEFRAAPAGGRRALTDGGKADLWSDLADVRSGFDRFGLLDDRVRFVQGPPTDALPTSPIGSIAMLRLGRGQVGDLGAILEAVGDRLSDGAMVLVDDSDTDAADALAEFRGTTTTAAERIGWNGLAWRHHRDGTTAAPSLGGGPVPLASAEPTESLDLSVVVIFHNMAREARRTLHSLSRTYQRDIDDVRYEVIAIDNGSDPDQRLTEEFVRSFGEEFRLIDLADTADPSPNAALNLGMHEATGRQIAFMIDGAHMLTPRVLRYGLDGLSAYGSPAVVATQQWYVGPGQQPDIVGEHYDQDIEDQLFENIQWPDDGYRLFEISHFIGERDWLDGIIESNCLFVGRDLLETVGGFDERFSMAGGGYTNLELYERLGGHPGTKLVTILGEGSFHQVHGGITTNDGSVDQRRTKIFGYGDHYRELRGRTLGGPGKHISYVGGFSTKSAVRTRSRRLGAMAFDSPDSRGEIPSEPVPIPDEIAASFIDSYWRSLAWQHTSWLGHPIQNTPTDLMIYQELISSIRPDQIVVVEREGSGTARYVASICELIGHGRVVSVGEFAPGDAPRLTHIDAGPASPRAVKELMEDVDPDATSMVILGAGGKAGMLTKEFAAYSPLVSVGSYLIFEGTVVNGNPVWPGYGPGPLEALRGLLPHHGEFVQDTDVERYGLTFNQGGYLRRLS
ncbi:MAG: CmcI family methyltransferase [Acidimicrobiales bacterium]